MSAPDKIGHITEKWWQTKKLFEWKFETSWLLASPLLEKLGPPVAAVSIEQSRANDKEEKVWFVARSNWFGRGRHTDGLRARTLEGLRANVEAAFRDRIIAHTDVEWSDWIEIEVHDRDVRLEPSDGRAAIMLEYKLLKRAKFPDGRDMVLDRDSLHEFPKARAAGTDRDRDYNSYYQDNDHQYAYIPATPENLEAVKNLMVRIDEVNQRLLGVLAQSKIKETVALLVGGQLRLEKK